MAQSPTESEYVALSTACKEFVSLRNLSCEFKDLDWNNFHMIYLDSQNAMKLAATSEVHERAKHIAVRWHFLRWMMESK